MMPSSLPDLLQHLTAHLNPRHNYLVGVDGGAGAGKSSFSRWLGQALRDAGIPAVVVLTESFYLPSPQRVDKKFPLAVVADVEWMRLRDQVLRPLRLGSPAHYQVYDWPADALLNWVNIPVGGVTIIDGVTSTRAELANYYDLRVWFSCPRPVRAARLLARKDTSQEEIDHWVPSEEEFFARDGAEGRAHILVDSSEDGYVLKKWALPGA
jgi:uridine kinase